MPRPIVEFRIPWPRNRFWRPGQPITIATDEGTEVTYRLRGVMRDHDPASEYATVLLEPIRTLAADLSAADEDLASAAS